MAATPADLFALLDRLAIPHTSVTHAPLFTVEQSRALRGQIPGAHTKNLFLKDKRGALFLVVAREDAVIDLKTLHHPLGAARFSFGAADLLREVWGVEPGSVTPFGALNDTHRRVTVVLDAAMMQHETLNFHPLINTMTTSIGASELVAFLEATGHIPRVLAVGGAATAGLAGAADCNHPASGPFNGHPALPIRGERPEMMLQQNGGSAPAAADDLVKDTTTQTFIADVIEASKQQPVLVDFWAPWCGPCKQLTPIIEKAVRAAKGKARLVKMNIDEHPAVSQQMGIQSIPAVIAFVNGQPVDGFMGALPESQVTAFIERLIKDRIGGEEKDLLAAADAALAGGDAPGAADLYAQLLAEDSSNIPALAGLARCYVETGAIEQAKQTLALVPEAKQNDASVAAARAALELAEQAASLGPLTELEGKLAANAADHQARYDLALALNAANRREDAVDHLIEIVRRDRKWNDDGARKQLVQLFEAWGPMDEATVLGRRRLSSLLFA